MFGIDNELLVVNVSILQDLLRTNTVEQTLFLHASNRYVRALEQVLQLTGYLPPSRAGASGGVFGTPMLDAIRLFNDRHRIAGDGARLKPYSLWRLMQGAEVVPAVRIVHEYGEEAVEWQEESHFLNEPLTRVLAFLQYQEADLAASLEQFCITEGRLFPEKALGPEFLQHLAETSVRQLGPWFSLDMRLPLGPVLEIADVPGNQVRVGDGSLQLVLTRREPGVYWPGMAEVSTFLTQQPVGMNPDWSQVSLRIIDYVSRHEGKLDAVNTYDQGFLSIGIFQWTLGIGDRAGELPALLKRVKEGYPEAFRKGFEELGLDIDNQTDTGTGFLLLDGERMDRGELKEVFRSPTWAFHFWKALMQPAFQAAQIAHAHDRFKHFYFKRHPGSLPYPLYQMITSSFGVALLLDMHVNRPGWVYPCFGLALTESGFTQSPINWTAQDESHLLDSFIRIRSIYTEGTLEPMTAANRRSEALKQAEREGVLSRERGSFSYLNPRLEGIGLKGIARGVDLPPGYKEESYPDLASGID